MGKYKNLERKQKNARKDFEKTIIKLRALKYTRQVTRPFLESLNPDQHNQVKAFLCIATIPREYKRGCPVNIKIIILIDKILSELQTAFEKAKNRASQPPLTHYEIQSDIQMITFSELKHQIKLTNNSLYLYPNYRPRKYITRVSLINWFEKKKIKELPKDSRIPLFANFAVDVAWVLEK